MAQRLHRKRFIPAVLEIFEPRQLMSASHFASAVYVETNNPAAGQNAVIAYGRNADGSLSEIGSFKTGGTGFANTQGLLGPDDADKQVIASPDGKFLFAVNQGSNSVAVFRIHQDGSLSLIHGAPFNSGGTQPVSLTIDGGRLYVTNRSDEIQGQAGTVPPTISVFNIDEDGSLDPVKSATVTLPQGLSPSQLLPSLDGKVLFADAFTPPPLLNVANSNAIIPFTVGKNGKLTAGTPIASPATPPLLLGLAQHPTQKIIYAGLTGASEIGVFTYDSSGTLTLASTVPVQGTAPCWTIVSANGQTLYSIDTATNSVGVFSLADALHPKQIQEFALGGPQNIANDPSAAKQVADFEFALDPSGKSLYVITHETTTGFAKGNAVHALSIAADGTLSENSGPSFLPAGLAVVGARPDGIATVALSHGDHDGHDRDDSHAIASHNSSDGDEPHGTRADLSVTVSPSRGIQSVADVVSTPNFSPSLDAVLQTSPHKPIDVSLADASL